MRLITESTCSCPWDWVMITADGTVRPCCYAKDSAGNLNDQSLEEIWNGRTMLEVRYFIEHNELHSLCRHAACTYAQAKEGAKARPHKVNEYRYCFADVAFRCSQEHVEVEGRVINCGETAWFLFDDAGAPRVRIGGRVIDGPSGATQQELFHPIQGEALFPGESAPFEFRVERRPGAALKLDLCSQGSFWFEEQGEKPLVIAL